MINIRDDYDPNAYNPAFKWSFLAPKYWGTWLTVVLCLPVALLPVSFRAWISSKVASYLVRKKPSTSHKASVNLEYCFPNKTVQERDDILYRCLVTAGTFLLGFAALSLRNRNWLESNSTINGLEHITNTLQNGDNAILLVPHTWAIDVPAILLASKGMPVSAMAKKQSNQVMDWLMHRQRVQYGGRVYERSGGIKPFIKSIREGYLGYYLPDQDHGPEHSIFVDFFATRKATLPGMGKLAKLSKAKIIPVWSKYHASTGRFEIDVYPPLTDFPSGSEELDARAMNQFIEKAGTQTPEQYMWILQLLKTQEDQRNIYKESWNKLKDK